MMPAEVAPCRKGWVSIYPERGTSVYEYAKELSAKLDTTVVAVDLKAAHRSFRIFVLEKGNRMALLSSNSDIDRQEARRRGVRLPQLQIEGDSGALAKLAIVGGADALREFWATAWPKPEQAVYQLAKIFGLGRVRGAYGKRRTKTRPPPGLFRIG